NTLPRQRKLMLPAVWPGVCRATRVSFWPKRTMAPSGSCWSAAALAQPAAVQRAVVPTQDPPTILGDLTVFHAPGVTGPFATGILGQHPLAVIRMQARPPEPGPPGLLRVGAE